MLRTRNALLAILIAGIALLFSVLLYMESHKDSVALETQEALFSSGIVSFEAVVIQDDSREKMRESMLRRLHAVLESNTVLSQEEKNKVEARQNADTASAIFTETAPEPYPHSAPPDEEFIVEAFPPSGPSRATTTLGIDPNATASTSASSTASSGSTTPDF